MRLRVTAVLFGTLVLGVMPLSRGVPAAASARADVWVEAREDYDPGRYQGPLQPSPPHADGNPRRAVIVGEVRTLGRALRDLGPLRCGDSDAVAALRLP